MNNHSPAIKTNGATVVNNQPAVPLVVSEYHTSTPFCRTSGNPFLACRQSHAKLAAVSISAVGVSV